MGKPLKYYSKKYSEIKKKISKKISSEKFIKFLNISTIIKMSVLIIASFSPIIITGRKRMIVAIFEVLAVFALTQIIGKKYKIAAYIFSSILFLLILINTGSFIFSGTFITYQMINNINNLSALGDSLTLYFTAAGLAIFISFWPMRVNLIEKNKQKIAKIFIFNNIIWFYASVLLIPNIQTPLVAYGFTINNGIKTYKQEKKIIKEMNDKREEILDKFKKENIDDAISINTENMNIILIFQEGLSSRVIDSNEEMYPGLMPNIAKFREENWSVENYWNHTAATYRGIRGSLYSSHQLLNGYEKGSDKMKDLNNTKIIGLQDILKNNNYNTSFINPEPEHHDFQSYIESLNFDNNPKFEISNDNGFNTNNGGNPYMRDSKNYEELFNIANEMNKKDKPFLLGTYIFETHEGMILKENNYNNNQNEYLDKFHNTDVQFGKFMEKFNESDLSDNTIIIFTTDHATYPGPNFKSTFNSDNQYFFDEIPLILYIPDQQARKIDANGSTSLTLSPTILDILNLEDNDNYFLGTTLFDKEKSIYESHFQDEGFVLTNETGIIDNQTNTTVLDNLNEFFSISLNLK